MSHKDQNPNYHSKCGPCLMLRVVPIGFVFVIKNDLWLCLKWNSPYIQIITPSFFDWMAVCFSKILFWSFSFFFQKSSNYIRWQHFCLCLCFPVFQVVALICNFSNSSDPSTARLNHGEVETLFHEFGHALHSLLSRTVCDALSHISSKM